MSAQTTSSAGRQMPALRVRHGIFAAALLAVAVLRALGGDFVWSVVLAAAGLVEVGLMWRDRTQADGRGAARDATAPVAAVVERSLPAHQRALRLWLFCVVICTCAALALLPSSSIVAAVVAVLALVSLHRVRRERRSVVTLSRLADPTAVHNQGAT